MNGQFIQNYFEIPGEYPRKIVGYVSNECKQFRKNYVPVAQWLEHCVSSAKVVGSIPREHMY